VSIAVEVSPWIIKMVDKFRRAFIWSGSNTVQGGQCLVACQRVARPVGLGGLGVLDLTTLGYALCLHWEWQAKTSPDRPCASLSAKPKHVVQAMFDDSVTVEVGNGRHALFWQEHWLDGKSLHQLAPDVVATVPKRTRVLRRTSVAEALIDDQWISDITGSLSVTALAQYVSIWETLKGLQLAQELEDKFIWEWSSNQRYSASSAYKASFLGQSSLPCAKELSKIAAPPRCKFFLWLALLDRCWTSARLQLHQLQNSGPCALCSQVDESIDHLLLSCVYSREVWFRILCVVGFHHLVLARSQIIAD
jgi:hypothetical protein